MTAPAFDPRSPMQVAADAAAAEGIWEGFSTEELATQKEAEDILDSRRLRVANHASSGSAAEVVRNLPFRWKDKVYRVLSCEYVNGHPRVETAPPNEELVAEISRRIKEDRFHHLNVYLGFGFVCFPEDYRNYQA